VEAVCNRVVIINKGKIVADGSISEVKNGQLQQNQTVIAAFDKPVEKEKLLSLQTVKSAVSDGENWEIAADGEADIRFEIFRFAVENNLTLLTLIQKQQNLESIFHQLTRGNDA
jgi:ABC-2 type transport system ATP-binding protein